VPVLPKESEKQLEVSLFWGNALLDVRTLASGRPLHTDLAFDAAVAAGLELGVGAGRWVPLEERSLLLRWTEPPQPLPTGLFDGIDFGFARILSVSALLCAMVLLGFRMTPTTEEFPPEKLFGNPSDILKYVVRPTVKPIHKFPVLPPGRVGDKPKGPPGRFGSHSAHQAEAAPSKKGSPIVDAKRREADRRRVLSTGLLGAFGANASAASDVLGPGGLGTGINDALGGLRPGGSLGTGPGGDGHAIGLGGLGTNGHDRGGGGPDLGLGGPGKDPVHIIQDKRTIGIALDKSVIAKVIRRHWNEIKYCYETQLNQNPHLAGKVAVAFTINGTGAVSEADVSESSMGNASVEDCILKDIKRWRFPEPRGNGQVFVTYPWVFKAAGEEE
jgi:TonB family protein